MKKKNVGAAFGTVIVLLGALACSSDRAPVGLHADAAPRAEVTAQRTVGRWAASGLLRGTPLAADVRASAVIGPNGGRVTIPAAGFELEVPRGAVSQTTTFTVTALKGAAMAYEFGPSGSEFPVPLRATQALDGARLPKGATLQIGYFADLSDLDATTGGVSIQQTLSGVVSSNGKAVSFPIPHFSGWIVHWRGEQRGDTTGTNGN